MKWWIWIVYLQHITKLYIHLLDFIFTWIQLDPFPPNKKIILVSQWREIQRIVVFNEQGPPGYDLLAIGNPKHRQKKVTWEGMGLVECLPCSEKHSFFDNSKSRSPGPRGSRLWHMIWQWKNDSIETMRMEEAICFSQNLDLGLRAADPHAWHWC